MPWCGFAAAYSPGPGVGSGALNRADRLRKLARPFGIASRVRAATSYDPGPGRGGVAIRRDASGVAGREDAPEDAPSGFGASL